MLDLLSYPLPPPSRRLLGALVVSALVHALITLSAGPGLSPPASPSPLQVDFERPQAAAGELSLLQSGDHPGVSSELAFAPQKPVADKPVADVSGRPALALPLPLDRYYAGREVDVRADQVNEVALLYPQQAYAMRLAGRVVLRIFIGDSGVIDNILVVEAMPPGVFEDAALVAARALHFKPALKDGRPVKSIKNIEVVFNPYDSIHIP